MPDNPFHEGAFLYTQSKPSLAQAEAAPSVQSIPTNPHSCQPEFGKKNTATGIPVPHSLVTKQEVPVLASIPVVAAPSQPCLPPFPV